MPTTTVRLIRIIIPLIVLLATGCGGGGSASPPAPEGVWTWMAGVAATNQSPVFGTQGVPNTANHPGSRAGSAYWTDAAGNAWLFGGFCAGPLSDPSAWGERSDLWRFDGSAWAWMGGPRECDMAGVYGTRGVSDAGNFPGAREGSITWKDGAGMVWLFGGWGHIPGPGGTYSTVLYNDVWRFDGESWAWMAGPQVVPWYYDEDLHHSYLANTVGVYGTPGVANPSNRPGGRGQSAAWVDSAGLFWLYSGEGVGDSPSSAGGWGALTDLWSFDGERWTWRGGGRNHFDPLDPVRGTLGVAAPENTPGARSGAAAWSDSAGRFWLFGGGKYGTTYADVWRHDGEGWAWMAGPSVPLVAGSFGIRGVPAAGNHPGSRNCAALWQDRAGGVWLFGGWGAASDADPYPGSCLSDVWRFDGEKWAWMGGSTTADQSAVWGTPGVSSPNGRPGARHSFPHWAGADGSVLIYGGGSPAPATTQSLWMPYSDLWRYTP